MTLRALVTAGGTREPIDDVRVITNLSRGRFGAAIARALMAAGVHTTVLGSRAALELLDDEPLLTKVPFGSFGDLQRELERATAESPPDLLFMAAAVSDYRPVPQEGKIRSDAEQLTITLEKTPKLLSTLRERCGVPTFLIGFKLLSGVSREELVSVALKQVKQNRLNLTVANDLSTFTESTHPIVLVTPEGGALPVGGAREDVARELVEFALKRFHVRWSPSEQVGETAEPGDSHADAGSLLKLAQDANLLVHSSDGNVTHRARSGLWATPRGVDKAALEPADLIHVDVDLDAGRVRYAGPRKASIDSAVHGWLYDRLPDLDALLHFHSALVLPDAVTSFPYPCGTREEAEACHAALAGAALDGRWQGGAFALELVDHGILLGLEPGGVARLAAEWSAAKAAYTDHLREVGEGPDDKRLAPAFAGAHIVGVEAQGESEGTPWTSLFLTDAARGEGVGARLLERLDARGDTVAVHARCGVHEFYTDRGYRLLEERGELTFLEPPSRRTDLIPAASVCLFSPTRGEVLMGERGRGAYVGTWSFPGGKLDAGESAAAGARRELLEETGLDLWGPVHRQRIVVGGEEAYDVACFVVPCAAQPAPRRSDEFAALRWVPLSEALALKVSPGVRGVLRWCQRRVLG